MRRLILSLTAALALLPASAVLAQSELVENTVESVAGATTVDSAAAKQLFDQGAIFVDLRKSNAWDAGRVPGAKHIDMPQFSQETLEKAAKKTDPVVFYCSGVKCPRSSAACEKALSWGYSKVYYYREGFPGWQKAGHPVE
jgi:rhodanese-related sulfurtransferase